MRGIVTALALSLGLSAAVMADAPTAVAQSTTRDGALDLSTPTGALGAMRRLWCTETDGEPVYWYWQGEAYARRMGERDKLLFKVQGLNVRTCGKVTDPVRGEGFRSVSRELLLYLDPETGRPLSRWTNPWTNESVEVLHVANDPVNGDFFVKNRDGSPLVWSGKEIAGRWFMTTTVPLFYSNPLGGPYQPEIGGTYHATEMFNFMGDVANLTGRRTHTADVYVGWVRMSDWLPWMKMGGRDGVIYMHTAGRKVGRWEDVSQTMRDEVARHYPTYRNPPPVDDRRPNVTSWSYFKAVREGREAAPKRD